MVRIAILDDNPYHIKDVRELLEEFLTGHCYCIDEYNDEKDFLNSILEKEYDVIFLDIVLNEKDGIEVGTIINDKFPRTNIIFISAYPEYFKDVYKVKHTYFLTKDFEKERFADAMSKVIRNINNNYVNFHTKKAVVRIPLNEVVYLEGYLKHTKICMIDKSVKAFNTDLRVVEARLPKENFLRIHQGYVVNMDYIQSYSRQNVTMVDGTVVPVSRSRLDSVRERLALFIGGVL